MDKQQILSSITQLSLQNTITKNEVIQAFENGQEKKTNSLTKDMGLSEVLYFIGGFIVFVGIAVLISQNWGSLNSFTKIIATFGFGVASYCVGVLLNKEEKYGAVGYAFHLIAALAIPLGLGVIFDQRGFNTVTPGVQSFIAGILFVMYLASYFVFKKPIFTFFSIAYATWFFFAFTSFLIGTNPYFTDIDFYEYRFLTVGLSYIFLGYYIATTKQKELTGVLYGFGSLFFLGAGLALGGWKPSQNILWEVVYPGLVFIILFLSVYLKSKPFLTFGTIFLMIYILKITGEYFSGTLGWPLSLMICGITLIGIGYYAFTLNKKYLSVH
ncbi:MAG TPA: DUF2157 domain-containing protein [Candidatus Saccharimonadales bacterium]|nr:DUF2157 domain-containing protein [Candidatus Saccharimonadales bacterium]